MTEKLTQKDYELINSYLDQELDRKDLLQFAGRIAEDPAVRSEVEDLMKVKSMMKELPTVTPPRNYILTRAMAEEARPKPFWERLFPVFRAAAAFCALALAFTFIFPLMNNNRSSSSSAAKQSSYESGSVEYVEEYDMMAAEEAAPMLRDEEIRLEDRDYGGSADSYDAVMPSYGVIGGNPRIEYMMRLEESQRSVQQSVTWDADDPPAGFISEETAAADRRDLLIRLALGLGLAGSVTGAVILSRKKKSLELS